jgi:hypothetical protein
VLFQSDASLTRPFNAVHLSILHSNASFANDICPFATRAMHPGHDLTDCLLAAREVASLSVSYADCCLQGDEDFTETAFARSLFDSVTKREWMGHVEDWDDKPPHDWRVGHFLLAFLKLQKVSQKGNGCTRRFEVSRSS